MGTFGFTHLKKTIITDDWRCAVKDNIIVRHSTYREDAKVWELQTTAGNTYLYDSCREKDNVWVRDSLVTDDNGKTVTGKVVIVAYE